MLLARRCPHTGVVNIFADAEPFLAIGSLVRRDAATCHWRCYVGQPACGAAPDMRTAERRLVGRYRQLLRAAVCAERHGGGCERRRKHLALADGERRSADALGQ
jgi:hypothetical protein